MALKEYNKLINHLSLTRTCKFLFKNSDAIDDYLKWKIIPISITNT